MATQVGEKAEPQGFARILGAAAAAMLPMALVVLGMTTLLPHLMAA